MIAPVVTVVVLLVLWALLSPKDALFGAAIVAAAIAGVVIGDYAGHLIAGWFA